MPNSSVLPGFSLPCSWLKGLLLITAQASWPVLGIVQITMDFIFADIVPQWRLNINLEAKEANMPKLVVMLTASISYRGSSSKQPWSAWFEFFISAWFKLLTLRQSRTDSHVKFLTYSQTLRYSVPEPPVKTLLYLVEKET